MKVFVSYRRADSQDIAARLAGIVNDTPGVSKVFIDVDGIRPGENFPARLTKAMDQSDVCLVLIGKDWAGANDGGHLRISDPGDFVRKEVESAFSMRKRVLPVLLNGALPPPTDALPDTLKALPELNALFLRHASFGQDADILLDAVLGRKRGGSAFFRRRPVLATSLKTIGGILIAAVLLMIGALANYQLTRGAPLERSLGGRTGLTLVVALTVVASVVISFAIFRRRRVKPPV